MMLRTRSALTRGIVTVIAIMQMAMPSVASIADAWLESARQAASQTHAEDPARSAPAPIHATDCKLCDFLNHCAANAPAHVVPPTQTVTASRIIDRAVVARRTHAITAIRSRAPPSEQVA